MFFLCTGICTARPRTVYDIVFDLDGTLVKTALSKPSSTDVYIEHVPHRLAYGAIELLSVLAQREDVRLSFFSAGDAKRNVPLVREIGKLVKELGAPWQVDVFSACHLAAYGAKDLQKLSREFIMDHTLLIDDTQGVGPPNQDRNLLQLVSFDEDGPHSSPQERLRARYSLVRVAGVLACSWEMVRSNRGVSWLDAVASLQWSEGAEGKRVMRHDLELYQKGLELLRPCKQLQIEAEMVQGLGHVFPYTS